MFIKEDLDLKHNQFICYHATPKYENVVSIMNNGFSLKTEKHLGSKYGNGVYMNYALNHLSRREFGYIIKSKIKTLDGFLIFNKKIAKSLYGNNWRLDSQIKNILKNEDLIFYALQVIKLSLYKMGLTKTTFHKKNKDQEQHDLNYDGKNIIKITEYGDEVTRIMEELLDDDRIKKLIKGLLLNSNDDYNEIVIFDTNLITPIGFTYCNKLKEDNALYNTKWFTDFNEYEKPKNFKNHGLKTLLGNFKNKKDSMGIVLPFFKPIDTYLLFMEDKGYMDLYKSFGISYKWRFSQIDATLWKEHLEKNIGLIRQEDINELVKIDTQKDIYNLIYNSENFKLLDLNEYSKGKLYGWPFEIIKFFVDKIHLGLLKKFTLMTLQIQIYTILQKRNEMDRLDELLGDKKDLLKIERK